ncbi:MAG: sodium/glutamate symporter [Pseudomonadota bacterium]
MNDTVLSEPIVIDAFISTTVAFLVYIVGSNLTRRSAFLRDFNIPEPVSGGLVAAALTMAIFVVWNRPVEFDLAARDYFLIVFFTGIGLNARLADLGRGGRPLAILLGLTVIFVLSQNVIGLVTALLFGLPAQMSVILGSSALIGGHGTVIAWGPRVAEASGLPGIEELGIAVATLGLVAAALIGGPIAKYLIARHQLEPRQPDADPTIGVAFDDDTAGEITHLTLMHTLLWVHITMVFGFMLWEALKAAGIDLPSFVPCMLMGILVGNLLPVLLPRVPPLRRTPTLAVLSDFALGTFLAMSLMSLQLWTLQGFGLTLLVVLTAQTLFTAAFAIFLVFRFMGRNYFAAVMASGFAGFGLGATPTAIANMTAVTKRYGASPLAFVVLPLVSAFFIDIINSFAIQFFLSL